MQSPYTDITYLVRLEKQIKQSAAKPQARTPQQRLNFIYNNQGQMTESLFNCERAFKLVSKIAELASDMDWQEDLGYFDFHKLLNFLRTEELFFGFERRVMSGVLPKTKVAHLEPLKSYHQITSLEEKAQWSQIVDFMRKNPRMLMQMIGGIKLPISTVAKGKSAQDLAQFT